MEVSKAAAHKPHPKHPKSIEAWKKHADELKKKIHDHHQKSRQQLAEIRDAATQVATENDHLHREGESHAQQIERLTKSNTLSEQRVQEMRDRKHDIEASGAGLSTIVYQAMHLLISWKLATWQSLPQFLQNNGAWFYDLVLFLLAGGGYYLASKPTLDAKGRPQIPSRWRERNREASKDTALLSFNTVLRYALTRWLLGQ
jgi:hypothetical protein